MKNMLRFLCLALMPLASFSQGPGFKWATRHGGTAGLGGAPMSIDASGNVYAAGVFNGTVDFDPGIGVVNLTSTSGGDIFITKSDSSGNLIWAKTIGGSGSSEECNDIVLDPAGNVYLVGYLMGGSGDYDPGPGVYTLTSAAGLGDLFVLKLTTGGNFVWAKTLPTNWFQYYSIGIDNANQLYITGPFDGTVDFDPGPGVFNLSSNGGRDLFILKLDNNGNFKFAKRVGEFYDEFAEGLFVDQSANIYLIGEFESTVDFDPGAAIVYMTATLHDVFVLKLDSSGTYQWAKKLGSGGEDFSKRIKVDNAGNIYCMGNFTGTSDFNPSAAVFNLTSAGSDDVYIVKLDASGNFIWAKSFGGTGVDFPLGLECSASGIYLAGYFSSTVDFDPGTGIYNLSPVGANSGFAVKLNPSGNFLWARSFNSSSVVYDSYLDVSENYHLSGTFSGTGDFNPTVGVFNLTAVGSQTCFYTKWTSNACSAISISVDSVINLGCFADGYVSAHAFGGQTPYSYQWSTTPVTNDSIATINSQGVYTITVTDANACSTNESVLVNGPETGTSFDLDASLIHSCFQSGFDAHLWVDGFNNRCTNSGAGQLKLILDSSVTYSSSFPVADVISGDTLTWNFSDLTFDSTHLTPEILVNIPATLLAGTTLHFYTIIEPVAGDGDTTNNNKHYPITVVSSFDPNIKSVFPAGKCSEHYILNDQRLEYTIHFQNTGSTSAVNIQLSDTLDAYLDLSSLRILASSHDVYTEMTSSNEVIFHFDNIMLPDGTSNEPMSHGYVVFKILPFTSLPLNTVIENKSDIFFDFNTPVQTNTVFSTITDVVPVYNSTVNASICPGSSYLLNGNLYTTAGTYVQNTFTNGGCDSIITLVLNAFPTYTTTVNDTFCQGTSYTLNSVVYTAGGTFSQSLASIHGCDSLLTLNLYEYPINAGVTQSGLSLIADDSLAMFQWVDCNTSFAYISTETNQVFIPSADGDYALIVFSNSCEDTSACYNITGTMVASVTDDVLIEMVPNPASTSLNILTKMEIPAVLFLYSGNGQLMFKKEIYSDATTIDVSLLPEGIYTVLIQTKEKIQHKKLIIKR